jgi:hypothetical protein
MMTEPKSSVLATEAEWLTAAHANSADKGYSSQYREGFKAAAGWVALHAEIAARAEAEVLGQP